MVSSELLKSGLIKRFYIPSFNLKIKRCINQLKPPLNAVILFISAGALSSSSRRAWYS